jgi:hypothetical protein
MHRLKQLYSTGRSSLMWRIAMPSGWIIEGHDSSIRNLEWEQFRIREPLHILLSAFLCRNLMFPSIIRISTQTVHGDYTSPPISVKENIDILLATHSTVGFCPSRSVIRPGMKSSNLNSSSLVAIYKPDI